VLPIGDDRGSATGAVVLTWLLIVLNVAAFMVELGQPTPAALQSFIESWGVVPREYQAGRDLAPAIPAPFWITLVTSMFLHGGWAHLIGNMLYLYVFGDNLERHLGRARFLTFYLACGLAAGLAHIAFNAGSSVPTVGASGAISGVLGGYLVLFPRNRIRVLTGMGVATVPAAFMLGLWIVMQFLNGFGSVADTSQTGGVAYMAHIGGFVAGMILIRLLGVGRRPALA
jgi:membrane associated rhomboid family serine protease